MFWVSWKTLCNPRNYRLLLCMKTKMTDSPSTNYTRTPITTGINQSFLLYLVTNWLWSGDRSLSYQSASLCGWSWKKNTSSRYIRFCSLMGRKLANPVHSWNCWNSALTKHFLTKSHDAMDCEETDGTYTGDFSFFRPVPQALLPSSDSQHT